MTNVAFYIGRCVLLIIYVLFKLICVGGAGIGAAFYGVALVDLISPSLDISWHRAAMMGVFSPALIVVSFICFKSCKMLEKYI
jgi:hypothetical protein